MKRITVSQILFLFLLVASIALLFYYCPHGSYVAPLTLHVFYPTVVLVANIAFINLTKRRVWCGLCPLMVSSSFFALGLGAAVRLLDIANPLPFVLNLVVLIAAFLSKFLIPLAGGFIYKKFLNHREKVLQ